MIYCNCLCIFLFREGGVNINRLNDGLVKVNTFSMIFFHNKIAHCLYKYIKRIFPDYKKTRNLEIILLIPV